MNTDNHGWYFFNLWLFLSPVSPALEIKDNRSQRAVLDLLHQCATNLHNSLALPCLALPCLALPCLAFP